VYIVGCISLSCNGFQSFVLLFYFFYLVFINFVAFLVIVALKPRFVVCVDNISEGSRDVAFEGNIFFSVSKLGS
jgi:hypothetical protein